MHNKIIALVSIILIVFSGCNKDIDPIVPGTGLYNFSFLKNNNPELEEDIVFTNYGQKIKGFLPHSVDAKSLVATFNHTGTSVMVDETEQQSGITQQDFSQVLTYLVKLEDGRTESYEVDAVWFTGLPMVYITTENNEEINSVDEYREGEVTIVGGRNFPDVAGKMKIRGRGHSTWYFHPKKPYQLKFNSKTEVLGMPAEKKWIFLAEHADKTLIRNRLSFEMGHLSNLEWTPKSVYAEVFVNDEYVGTYHVSEKVEESKHRVDLGGTGYLIEIDVLDHIEPDDIYFYSSQFLLQVKEPEIDSGSSEFNYIKEVILDFENALYSDNFTDPEYGYKKHIDIESVVDWYLINEIAKNQDAKDYSSIYLHHIPGQKIKMGPIWDFDLGYGNVDYSDATYPTDYWVRYHKWINRMFEDPEFVALVKERFAFFKSNKAYLFDFIDSTAQQLEWAQQENTAKWDIIGTWVWPNPVVYQTYQEEVNHLKDWLNRRMNWLDDVYSSL